MLLAADCSAQPQSNSPQSSASPATDVAAKDEVIVAVSGEKESGCDPCTGWGSSDTPVFQSKLLGTDTNNQLKNDPATEYSVSEDGLIWTLRVRGDVVYHDGGKLTASDVAFTYNKTKENGISTIDLTLLDRAETTDDTTVVLRMKSPMSTFIYQTTALGIVPKHAYSDPTAYAQKPIGSSPYKFVQWDEGQQLIIEANENYYNGNPPFKRLVLLFLSDNAAYAALQAGQADVAKTSESLVIKGMSGYSLMDCKTNDFRTTTLPVQKPGETSREGYAIGNEVTSDPVTRRALVNGVNHQKIIDTVLSGYGEVTYTISQGLPWDNKEVIPTDGNMEAAEKILDNAGWMDTNGDRVREKNGKKAEFNLIYASDNSTRQSISMAFSEQARTSDINVITEDLSSTDRNPRKHKDAFMLGGGNYDPAPVYSVLYGAYAAKGGWYNIIAYKNPTIDKYLETAIVATTWEEANQYRQKAQWGGTTDDSIFGDAPYIYVANISHLRFVWDGISIGEQRIHPHDHGFTVLGDIMDRSAIKQSEFGIKVNAAIPGCGLAAFYMRRREK